MAISISVNRPSFSLSSSDSPKSKIVRLLMNFANHNSLAVENPCCGVGSSETARGIYEASKEAVADHYGRGFLQRLIIWTILPGLLLALIFPAYLGSQSHRG